MFLARFAVNAARRQARFLLASPQAMHAAVLSSFPPETGAPSSQGRVLWRIDADATATWLYVVSPHEPDLTHLVEQAGWPTTQTWESRSYGNFLDQLEKEQTYAFRLRANPVHQVRGEDGTPKRYGHVTVQQQTAWFLERCERIGVTVRSRHANPPAEHDAQDGVQDVVLSRRERLQFRRGDRQVTLSVAQFDGRLTVIDAELLRTALVTGIGRAKGYGCGLMTLARA